MPRAEAASPADCRTLAVPSWRDHFLKGEAVGYRQLEQWTSRLTDDVIAAAAKAELAEEYNFVETMDRVRVIRRLAEAYDEAPPDERPDPQNNIAQQSLERVVAALEAIAALQFGGPEYHQQRSAYVNGINEESRTWRQEIRPHIRNDADLTERAIEAGHLADRAKQTFDEIDTMRAQIVSLEEQASSLVEKIKDLSGELGAAQLASHYEKQAKDHREASNLFIAFTVLAAGALIGIGLWMFSSVPKRSTTDWSQLVPELTIRLFVLGVIGYAVSFCSKSYRANKHLQYSNEHRRNALKTYILFRESTSDPDVQNIITTELVKAVFSHEETGFLDKSGEKTIIEEQSNLLGLLGALRKS